jgi:hypothetical protein
MTYSSDPISVDHHFVRCGAKSYAINKINSVEVRTTRHAGSRAWWLWWPLGALLLTGAFNPEAKGSPAPFIVIAALFAFLGYRSFLKRRTRFSHQLYLMTSSGEVQAFSTDDADYIRALRASIEDAIAAH